MERLTFAYLMFTASSLGGATLLGVFKSKKAALINIPQRYKDVPCEGSNRVAQRINEENGQIWVEKHAIKIR